jgi:hypothetical protein
LVMWLFRRRHLPRGLKLSIDIIFLFFNHAWITLVIYVDNLFLSLWVTLFLLHLISNLFVELVLLDSFVLLHVGIFIFMHWITFLLLSLFFFVEMRPLLGVL